MKRIALLSAMTFCLMAALSCLTVAAEFILKVGIAQPSGHSFTQAMEQFKKEIEEKSGGKVAVQIFADNQLGSERSMQEAVSLGNLEITITGVLASYDPLLAILELPYLFENRDQIKAFHRSPEVARLIKNLETHNIKLIAFYENGFRQMTNNRRPIVEPADVRGLAIRTPENPAQMETFRQLGAVVTPMASTELYSALQQGVVDGQENPIQNIYNNKFYEVQKHLAITNHIYNSGYVILSNDLFQRMPADLQTLLLKAIENSAHWQMNLCADADTELLERIKSAGIQVTQANIPAFMKAVEPVYDVFIGRHGDDAKKLIEAARTAK
ncbi:MAG: TRAP transporter substrate-binding protein [Planctomycetes bacterium]|nr:TRAP transporter substrate-binding protein [Planctomycetota bacterium]